MHCICRSKYIDARLQRGIIYYIPIVNLIKHTITTASPYISIQLYKCEIGTLYFILFLCW